MSSALNVPSIELNGNPFAQIASQPETNEQVQTPPSLHRYLTKEEESTIRSLFVSPPLATSCVTTFRGNAEIAPLLISLGRNLTYLACTRDAFLQAENDVGKALDRLRPVLAGTPWIFNIQRKVATVRNPDPPKVETLSLPNGKGYPNSGNTARQPTGTPSGTPTDEPQKSTPVVQSDTSGRAQAPPQTPRGRGVTPTPSNRSKRSNRKRPQCPLCGRLDHLRSQCPAYHCPYCDTLAPGHTALRCTKNPHAGTPLQLTPIAHRQWLAGLRKPPTAPYQVYDTEGLPEHTIIAKYNNTPVQFGRDRASPSSTTSSSTTPITRVITRPTIPSENRFAALRSRSNSPPTTAGISQSSSDSSTSALPSQPTTAMGSSDERDSHVLSPDNSEFEDSLSDTGAGNLDDERRDY